MADQKEVDTRKNWADEDPESDGEETKEIGQSTVPAKSLEPIKRAEPAQPKKDYGPPEDRARTQFGDYVVTKINIPDPVIPQVEVEKDSDEESDEESEQSEHEEQVEEQPAAKKGKFFLAKYRFFRARQATLQEGEEAPRG